MLAVLIRLFLVQCTFSMVNGEEELSLDGRNRACDVLIAFDESLYDYHDGNMTYLANLAKDHLKVQICSAVWNVDLNFIIVYQAAVKSYCIG